jgi:homoserine O-acetyltransferase
MPELRLHYTTIGEPTGQRRCWCSIGSAARPPLHATPTFGGELFGAGQPL